MSPAKPAPVKPKRRSPVRSPVPRPMRGATKRQHDFLRAVQELTAALGRAPNAREVGDHMGMTRTGARLQLLDLERKGLLEDMPKIVSSGQWALTAAGKASQG